MVIESKRTYVGFGFGPIQAGLFLHEAQESHAFHRFVVAEIIPERVEEVRRAHGTYRVNVAHDDRIECVEVGPIEIANPNEEVDRYRLVEAVAEADEIGTAVPSVSFYTLPGNASIHRILAAGLRTKVRNGGPRAVIYAAENHNHAAEILEKQVLNEVPEPEQAAVSAQVRFLNTVIGKMSGVLTDPGEIGARNLSTVTPYSSDALLVEEFNRILISRIDFPDNTFHRGITAFAEKDDLLPFEEAKLYGHNAAHALAAYLGAACGVQRIDELRERRGILRFMRHTLLEESGEALIRKYGGRDSLFTPDGYRVYIDDLLERMTNPYLGDTVGRVGRDPARKLGWDDRLIGTMRLALSQGINPQRHAVGAAAALVTLRPEINSQPTVAAHVLRELWQNVPPAEEESEIVLRLVLSGLDILHGWRDSGFADLETLYENVAAIERAKCH